MTRRRPVWVGAVCLALAVGLGLSVVYPGAGITEANFRCLRAGMTEAEVEGILGRPADQQTGVLVMSSTLVRGPWKGWRGEGCEIRLWFDHAGTLSHKDLLVFQRPTFLSRLRAWLGW